VRMPWIQGLKGNVSDFRSLHVDIIKCYFML
jgi:hypothetical protein